MQTHTHKIILIWIRDEGRQLEILYVTHTWPAKLIALSTIWRTKQNRGNKEKHLANQTKDKTDEAPYRFARAECCFFSSQNYQLFVAYIFLVNDRKIKQLLLKRAVCKCKSKGCNPFKLSIKLIQIASVQQMKILNPLRISLNKIHFRKRTPLVRFVLKKHNCLRDFLELSNCG